MNAEIDNLLGEAADLSVGLIALLRSCSVPSGRGLRLA